MVPKKKKKKMAPHWLTLNAIKTNYTPLPPHFLLFFNSTTNHLLPINIQGQLPPPPYTVIIAAEHCIKILVFVNGVEV